jgi:hypothetical protein
VEGGERFDEGLHCRFRLDAEFTQPVTQGPEMLEFGRSHSGEGRLVRQRRRHPRIGGHALEGGHLSAGQSPENVDDAFLLRLH